MIGAFAYEQSFAFGNIQISACPPRQQEVKKHMQTKYYDNCRASLKLLWASLKDYQVIMVSASWLSYYLKSNNFLSDFYQTVHQLTMQNKQVIILGKAPVFSSYNKNCMARSLNFLLMKCYRPSKFIDKKIAHINSKLLSFANKNSSVDYFDANQYLCRNNNCSAYKNRGKALYLDQSHLSIPGSWKLGKEIIKHEGVPYPFNLLGD